MEAEIKALLELPEGAREALTGCDGPGWWVLPGSGDRLPPPTNSASPGAVPEEFSWLPCSPLAILEVAAKRWAPGGCGKCLVQEAGGPWVADLSSGALFEMSMVGKTAHLAVLALLAEVWK